jgi:hypothetical protein
MGLVVALDLIAEKNRPLDIGSGIHIPHPWFHDVNAVVFSSITAVEITES